ncbi:MAG: hypothetical protein M3P51_14455 [Chloroflexota bacterium]|nr:hypothetical protein [Chloroflexota bacterium]
MDRGDDAREEPERGAVTEGRPLHPSKEDLNRWAGMSSEDRFRDPDHQRWAQSFRTRESLSAAGKEGYSVTVSRYGKEYLHDRMADKRRESELPRSVSERQLMSMLEQMGQRQDRSEYGGQSGNYFREHKLAPSRHADFAWPDKHKAIEVWGGVHTEDHFVRQERVREANLRQIERAQAAGWEVMIVTDEDLRVEKWDETRERVRRFLA